MKDVTYHHRILAAAGKILAKLSRICYTVTGGRPMEFKSSLFYDNISGERVCHYVDKLGRNWMTTSKWSWFRVPFRGR